MKSLVPISPSSVSFRSSEDPQHSLSLTTYHLMLQLCPLHHHSSHLWAAPVGHRSSPERRPTSPPAFLPTLLTAMEVSVCLSVLLCQSTCVGRWMHNTRQSINLCNLSILQVILRGDSNWQIQMQTGTRGLKQTGWDVTKHELFKQQHDLTRVDSKRRVYVVWNLINRWAAAGDGIVVNG